MKWFAASFLLTISIFSLAEAAEVQEEGLPQYKHCHVWLQSKGEFMVGYKNGVATHYDCGGGIHVMEFKNGENEKPFQIHWSQALNRDQNGMTTKEISRVYVLKDGVYVLTERYWR